MTVKEDAVISPKKMSLVHVYVLLLALVIVGGVNAVLGVLSLMRSGEERPLEKFEGSSAYH